MSSDEPMKRLLQEAVDGIRRCMPDGSELVEWFLVAPKWNAGLSPELHYWAGYINGAADYSDITPEGLLDMFDIDYSNDGTGT